VWLHDDSQARAGDLDLRADDVTDTPHDYAVLFDCMICPETRRYLSEDFAFCARWRALGGFRLKFQATLNVAKFYTFG
jgi:hypothetical protein